MCTDHATLGKELIGSMTRVGQNVVTLSLLFIDYRKFSDPYTLKFPSLRHLRIEHGLTIQEADQLMQEITIPILKNSGSNIHSIYIHGEVFMPLPPLDIWELCPKLNRFGNGIDFIPPPPSDHPVHTYIAPNYLSDLRDFKAFHWPNLQRVVMDKNWADKKDIPEPRVSDAWSQMAAKRGVRIEDRNGHTWKEHILLTTESPAHSNEEDDTKMDIIWSEEDDTRMDASW